MKTNFFAECLDWTLMDFLNFRQKEENWTVDKVKEYNMYIKTLGMLTSSGSSEHQSKAFSALKAFTVNITMLDNLNEDTTVLDGLGSRYPRLTITLYHITTLDNLNSDITVLGQVVDDYHDEASGENVFYFWHTIAQEKKELKLMTLENKKMIFQKEKDMLIERTALQHVCPSVKHGVVPFFSYDFLINATLY
ncbi:2754_t:CDS:2 [Entrophospora sp. SA101]|nr:2754_t:CDS:2 [Entrophospora sp. SA101]